MWYATCSVSTEHTEQQSNIATEHSAGHVTHRSAVLAAGRDERRRYLTFCLRPHYSKAEVREIVATQQQAITSYHITHLCWMQVG